MGYLIHGFYFCQLQVSHNTNVMNSHKTRTSTILGKLSFWYHCKEHNSTLPKISKLTDELVFTPITDNKCLDKEQKATLYGGVIKRPGRPELDYP